jgi:two-component system phosphate regulon sensor histidine kinase PhoR
MTQEAVNALLEALPFPALAIDRSSRIIAANLDAQTLVGPNLLDRSYITMLRQPALLESIEQVLQDGVPRMSRYLTNDGAQDITYEVSLRSAPGVGAQEAGAVIMCFVDISDREEIGQMRRDFVANVSHELRTPLTSLMGFIETLKGPARNDAEASGRFLEIMQTEAERMNRLVGDLMSLNRVERDERVRPTEKCDLIAILDSVCRTLGPLAGEAGVTLERDHSQVSVQMAGDSDQLTQVFTNLVENAIKYGGSGGRVTLRVRLSDREPAFRGPGVRVQVTDYGVGIDSRHLPRLTERFYRGDDHRSRAMGGTGLGLAIVKHIINRHRGRLRVESELGQGATFTVLLPINALPQS